MEEKEEKKKNTPLDPIAKAFGLETENGFLKPNGKFIVPDQQDDFEYARQNITDIIEVMGPFIKHFGEISTMANEPRHFEVLTNMITSYVDCNHKLVALKQTKLDIESKTVKKEEGGPTVNNNLIVTADELLTMLDAADAGRAKTIEDKSNE